MKSNYELPENTDDDIEMEEVIHDYDKMCSMSVIEEEINLIKSFIKKTSGEEKGFYQTKLENVEFAKGTMETNV